MSKNLAKIFLLAIILSSFFVAPVFAKGTINDAMNILNKNVKGPAGYSAPALAQTFPEMVGFWIKIALSIAGVVFFVFMVYAGITWMLARGEEEKIKTAQNTIIMAVIGLMIVVSGYAISNFVVTRVVMQQASSPGTGTPELGAGPLGCCVDWVSSGEKYTDIFGKKDATQFDSQRACRVTTLADCKLQGESTTDNDKLGCPEGNGCWLFYDLSKRDTNNRYKDTGQESQDNCAEDHC